MESMIYHALEVGLGVLGLVLAWVAAKLGQLIAAKVANEYLGGVLVRLNDAVWTVVKDVQQTVVVALKEANADGKIEPAERERIQKAALESLKSYLGVKGLASLAKIFGLDPTGIDALLSSKIESAVYELRQAGKASALASPLNPR